MVNLKVAGGGIVATFVVIFLETIFIPMIVSNLSGLTTAMPVPVNVNDTAQITANQAVNTTIQNTQKLSYVIPLFTLIGGIGVSIGAGVLVK